MAEALLNNRSVEAASFKLGAALYAPSQLRIGIFTTLLRALHEARRRQAERDLRRHQYLLNRYASPPVRE